MVENMDNRGSFSLTKTGRELRQEGQLQERLQQTRRREVLQIRLWLAAAVGYAVFFIWMLRSGVALGWMGWVINGTGLAFMLVRGSIDSRKGRRPGLLRLAFAAVYIVALSAGAVYPYLTLREINRLFLS